MFDIPNMQGPRSTQGEPDIFKKSPRKKNFWKPNKPISPKNINNRKNPWNWVIWFHEFFASSVFYPTIMLSQTTIVPEVKMAVKVQDTNIWEEWHSCHRINLSDCLILDTSDKIIEVLSFIEQWDSRCFQVKVSICQNW